MVPYPLGGLGLEPIPSGDPAAQFAMKINIKVATQGKKDHLGCLEMAAQ